MKLYAGIAAIVVTAACTKANPEFCDSNTPCTDPGKPYCDLAGEFGDANTCVANPFDGGVPSFDATPLPDGPAKLTVALTGSGSGTVTSTPSGIDCGTTCEAEYGQGINVVLSSSSGAGTTFVTWGGDCARGFEDCAITMSLDRSVTATFGLTGEHLFSDGYGAGGDDAAHDVAFDAQGNLAIAGSFSGSVDFGDGNPLTADSTDAFVARYDSAGELSWVTAYGGTGIDTMYAVATDPAGDVYALGSLNEVEATAYPMIMVKLSGTDGSELWREDFLGSGLTVPTGMAANATHVVAVGYFSGTVDLGGGDVMGRGVDGFLLRYTVAGDFVRATRIQAVLPDLAFEFANDVALDSTGSAVVVGTTNGTTFNVGGDNLPPLGGFDAYVMKYSGAGAHQWSLRVGGASDEEATAVAVDGDGHVYVSGSFANDVDFGDGTVTANTAAIGGRDAFVVSYAAADGSYRWFTHFGGTNGTNRGLGIAASPRGTVHATGTFERTVDFGAGGVLAAGDNDIYAVELQQSNGDHVRSARYGASDDDKTSSPDEVSAIAVDDVGRVAIVGFTANSLSFGGPAVASVGGTDVFIAVFGP